MPELTLNLNHGQIQANTITNEALRVDEQAHYTQ
jgi:hypothetical protein